MPVTRLARTAVVIATALSVGIPIAATTSDRTEHSGSYSVGLFGDVPYGAAGREEYPRLLADLNHSRIAFSVFDGDLKAGGDGACTDQLYYQSRDWFDSLNKPVVVTPGDNDWTDCWGRYGPGTGGFDALERLDFERSVFYPSDLTLGRHPMRVERESADAGYEAYRENARWVRGPVLFLTLNVQGSNDNLPHAGVDGEARPAEEIARMAAEHAAREQANIHWLHDSYAKARRLGLKGVMVVWQADPNFSNESKLQPLQYDGFDQILPALRTEVIDFPGQSALVHGDSHYFKVDKPLTYDDGQVVAKFTRVETFGAANTHWVRATVDPEDPNLFEFAPQIVPGNVNDR